MEEKTQLPYLPQDLLIQIFYKLPIKSLVRFRGVSKYWYSFLSSNSCFTIHYTSFNPSSYVYLLNYQTPAPEFTSNFALIRDSQLNKSIKIAPPFSYNNGDDVINMKVVGSINGVVCLAFGSSRFILWNPATRDLFYVPSPKISDELINKCFFGFGSFNDMGSLGISFWVIRVVWKNCRHQWRNGDPYCCTPEMQAELYHSSTNNWIEIGNVPKSFLLCTGEDSTTVRGTHYWCTYTWRTSIISFDPNLRKFSEFDGPGLMAEDSELGLGWHLGEISGTLSAFRESTDGGVDVWKMVGSVDGGSLVTWVKHIRVVPSNGAAKVVKCWKNGEFVVARVVDYPNGLVTKLSLYDPWTKNSRLLLDFPTENRYVFPKITLCIESLILPCDQINCALNRAHVDVTSYD